MKSYAKIPGLRIFGARVYAHWSVAVVAIAILGMSARSLTMALVGICSYFGMILLHEAGHAYFAKRQRLDRLSIRLSAIHGTCAYEKPESPEQEYIVAWGGVIAQLVVAIPLVVSNNFFAFANIDPFGPIVAILGYYSLIVVAMNLIPAHGLDGGKAWRLLPLLVRRWRRNEFQPRKRRGNVRVVK